MSGNVNSNKHVGDGRIAEMTEENTAMRAEAATLENYITERLRALQSHMAENPSNFSPEERDRLAAMVREYADHP